jgi:hypothetical protein
MIVASILALVLSFAFDLFLPDALETAPGSAAAHTGDSADSPSAPSTAAASTTAGDDEPGVTEHGTINASNGEPVGVAVTLPANVSLLPIIAFFLGFYPKRAALGIERIVVKVTRNIIPGSSYRALPLSMLAGMSYSHELRLEREGFDNVENLTHADAVDLAIRTCFSYAQLKQWIDQAWLASHLREDYPDFVRRTGITNSEELHHFFSTCDSIKVDGVEQLLTALSVDPAVTPSWKLRLSTIKILLNISPDPAKGCSTSGESEHALADIASP